MSHRNDGCTMKTCPVSDSVYGYRPSVPANAFFLAVFSILLIAQLVQGFRQRTWFFGIVMVLGCAGEAAGYAGRIILHGNVFSEVGFELQICTLIFSPAFIAAGIYVTLSKVVIIYGADFSLLKPIYYTVVFIASDFLALVFQGTGGGIAASAKTDAAQKSGTSIMLAGICLQVVSLLVFAFFCAEYFLRVRRNSDRLNPATAALRASPKLHKFLWALLVSFLTLFVRCVYRIPELSGGWRNSVMQSERDFIVLDGVMVTLAVLALTIFHPGFCVEEQSRDISKDCVGSDSDLESADKLATLRA